MVPEGSQAKTAKPVELRGILGFRLMVWCIQLQPKSSSIGLRGFRRPDGGSAGSDGGALNPRGGAGLEALSGTRTAQTEMTRFGTEYLRSFNAEITPDMQTVSMGFASEIRGVTAGGDNILVRTEMERYGAVFMAKKKGN